MVLSQAELLSALQHEVRILVHLAGKFNPDSLGYRPTPKQRSALELFRYLSMMGPVVAQSIKAGAFDVEAWTQGEATAASQDLTQVLATLEGQPDRYAELFGEMTDQAWRVPVEMFGTTMSRGAHMVSLVLGGHAAYRTQLFLYLKSCGRVELGTYNLWAGMDDPTTA